MLPKRAKTFTQQISFLIEAMYILDTQIAGQLVGGISLLLAIVAYYQKQDVNLKVFLALLFIVHATHFYLLDAIVPALLCLLSMVRTIIAIYTRSLTTALAFIVISILVGLFNYQSYLDILVILANIVGVYSLFCLQGVYLRLGIIAGASLWLVNNALIGSIGGTLMEIFVISTNLITIYRIRRPKHL
ncbi:YgjV family protein [Aliiglaciecola sp. 3_MG-2023]|uniref:YgjV family protein n=1 Tax=Aliiglaciecola sp. 3_MG-2023 TaxID=3062644 RepID=UPI0026E28A98|nr:YgjV family protein [Aliiglaciecola sp. 3_MG-2023]MDO6693316.1 YgjV family protein [Aliiglaciecola sp. 3_MG-2023]